MTMRPAESQIDYFRGYLKLCGLQKEHLICPLFVSDEPVEIGAMPGLSMTLLSDLEKRLEKVSERGIRSVIIFGVPTTRTATGSVAMNVDGIVQKGLKKTRANFGSKLTLLTDVCVCQYNMSGHCGIVNNGKIDNDRTLTSLAQIAISHVEAGADVVAPSAMMDGQVQGIRTALDLRGLTAGIMSYSAKHSSSLYAPFRSAAFAKSRTALDKSTYQVSYANPREALREIESDIEEGADMVMIKPALAYLDLIRQAKDTFGFPLAAQNVSGEYAMIKAAAMEGMIDEEEWKVNVVGSIRRAGADRIISYFAEEIAEYL
jgi:porphobilinogen synthase